MKALQSLTDLFKTHVADEKNLYVWAENGAIFSAQGEHVNGFEIEYSAVVLVQDENLNPETLFMHLVSWLNKYDPERQEKGLAMPTFAVEPLDKGKVDIKITLDIREEFTLERNEQGDWMQAGSLFSCENTFEKLVDEDELEDFVHFVGHEKGLPCQTSR